MKCTIIQLKSNETFKSITGTSESVSRESDWFYEQDIGPYPDLDKVLVLKCIFSGDGVYYRPCFAVRII